MTDTLGIPAAVACSLALTLHLNEEETHHKSHPLMYTRKPTHSHIPYTQTSAVLIRYRPPAEGGSHAVVEPAVMVGFVVSDCVIVLTDRFFIIYDVIIFVSIVNVALCCSV